jgi:outer membrane protein
MKKYVFLVLTAFLCMCHSTEGLSEEKIIFTTPLSLEQCLAIAEVHHPNLKASRAKIDVADSQMGQVASKERPQVDVSSSYSRQESSAARDGDTYSTSAGISQLITDAGKTKAEKSIARLKKESASQNYKTIECQVQYNVKKTYFDALEAQKDLEVAEETLNLYTLLLTQAQAFYDVGSVPKYDVTTAVVEQSKARLGVVTAKTAIKKARAELNNAMGVTEAPEYVLKDVEERVSFSIPFDEVLKTALRKRADLLASEIGVKAAKESIRLAAKGNAPEVRASGKYAIGGSHPTEDDNWSVGVTLQIPLYDGGLEGEKINQARAELVVAEGEEESLRSDVRKEVEQAYMEFIDSDEVLAVAQKTVQQAEENLTIAQNRYKVGVGSPIEVADATEKFKEAKQGYWSALYSHHRSWAALEKVVGGTVE